MKKQTKIPLLYQIVLSKVYEYSSTGQIKICELRKILEWHMRVHQYYWNDIYSEMKSMKLITFESKRTGIKVLVDKKNIKLPSIDVIR